MDEQEQATKTKLNIPSEFKKIIADMTKDILISFPEQKDNLHKELKNVVFELDKEGMDYSLKYVYIYCKTMYPVRFFDILYQNNTLFEKDDAELLPGIKFKQLWSENISDKTRETIWKYLQLVLFTVVAGMSDGNSFGDTGKLFEAINEDDFKTKLEETIEQMQDLFGKEQNNKASANDGANDGASDEKSSGINLDDLPNPSDIHEHVTGMMNGKLGKLAREIAEETAADLNINMDNAESINDVFKRLIHNPTKLLSLVKNVGSKLDQKIKSGDMKESELLEEASELMKKMKNMPGMGDIQSMLNKMGMGSAGKGAAGGGKVNVNAMQATLDRNLKNAKNKERLLKKMTENKATEEAKKYSANSAHAIAQKEMENLVFSTGETVERSSREQMPSEKKKKNKKKK